MCCQHDETTIRTLRQILKRLPSCCLQGLNAPILVHILEVLKTPVAAQVLVCTLPAYKLLFLLPVSLLNLNPFFFLNKKEIVVIVATAAFEFNCVTQKLMIGLH